MDRFPHYIDQRPYRKVGSETEFTVPFDEDREDLVMPQPRESASKENGGKLRKLLPPEFILANPTYEDYWLANGGRMYFDYGSVLEYATPECRNADQLAIYEKAGERTVAEVTRQARLQIAKVSPRATTDWDTYKRTAYVDVWNAGGQQLMRAMSVGHHENYETGDFDLYNDRMSAELESYLATRAIWAGAGMVTGNGYAIHQKAFGMSSGCISETPNNENRTSHGFKCNLLQHVTDHRLEIRSGDGNMSPWAIRTKFAMTSFVLRLIEYGKFPSELVLPKMRGPLPRMVSRTPDVEFWTIYDEKMIATEHQRAIARACLDFAKDNPLISIPASEIRGAEQVEAATVNIDTYFDDKNALVGIADRIDWAAKLHLMHEYGFADTAITADNLTAVMRDLKTEKVSPSSALNKWYRKVGNTIDEREITRAQLTPPNTRAKHRAHILTEYAYVDDSDKTIGWDKIEVLNFFTQSDRNQEYLLND